MNRRRTHGLHASTTNVRRLVVIMPIALTAYLLAAGESGMFRVWRQAERIGELETEIARVRAENAELERESTLLRTDLKTIERIARERYGMVKENESVYMVYPAPPEKRSP